MLTSNHHGLLRCVKALAHVSINVVEMVKMGISNDLQHSFEVANKQAIRDPHLMRSAQLFPVLKCAFCATDVSEIPPFLPSFGFRVQGSEFRVQGSVKLLPFLPGVKYLLSSLI